MRHIIIVFLYFLIAFGLVFAGPQDYYGSTIVAVKLSKVVAVDSSLVFNSSGLIPGEILTAAKVQDAIKNIYALGLFSDVIIEGKEVPGGVELLIKTETYPRVSEIRFEGNKKVKKKALKKTITIYEGRIVSPGTIKSNIERIKDLYEDKGYLLAKVESKLIPDEKQPDRVVLTFLIDEGCKVKIKDIDFSGNKVFDDGKLRSKMSTKRKSFFRGGSFDSEKYREDKQKIIDFYKKEGFIDAVIIGDSIWYSDDYKWMYLRLYVREGERYYFGKLTWDGNNLFTDDKIASVIKIKQGQKYNQEKYDETIFKLHEIYQDEGYWYARIDDHKTPHDNVLDINFKIEENDPVYVRMIHIEGNTKTKDKVIRRELKIKPNMIFKRSILGRSLRDVMMLNFFGNITPDWNILDNGDIDLIVKVEEKPTGQFQLGAGYSARDKIVGTLGLGFPNFLGGGQTVSFDAEFGKIRNTFNVSYFDPWFLDTPTSVGLSLYVQERRWYDWFTEGRRGGSIRVGRRLRWPDNYFKLFTSYRLEELKYFDIEQSYIDKYKDIPYSVDKIKWPQRTSSMNLTIERDSRDLAMFATKGSVAFWSGELAGTALGGDWNFWKQIVGMEYYYTPFWKFTFVLKGKWGVMDGIYEGDEDVPYSERFTPGGTDPDGIIRGYPDSRVGPRSADGGYLGGRSEVIYNLELTVPLAEQQFYALLFADAGNAYMTGDGLKRNLTTNFYKSVGFGFRVVAPMIGIIGFDFGYPLDGEDKGDLRPHFQIGRGF